MLLEAYRPEWRVHVCIVTTQVLNNDHKSTRPQQSLYTSYAFLRLITLRLILNSRLALTALFVARF